MRADERWVKVAKKTKVPAALLLQPLWFFDNHLHQDLTEQRSHAHWPFCLSSAEATHHFTSPCHVDTRPLGSDGEHDYTVWTLNAKLTNETKKKEENVSHVLDRVSTQRETASDSTSPLTAAAVTLQTESLQEPPHGAVNRSTTHSSWGENAFLST